MKKSDYSDVACKQMLRDACRRTRHVLTQVEIEELSNEGNFPDWDTLQKEVGPWFLWSEMFLVPFKDDKKALVASLKRDEYMEQEEERRAAEMRFKAKQRR